MTAVRPHLVWGPGDTQLIGRIAERARAGRLVLVDDGAALIDTTYIDNAAEAIAQAVERCAHPDVHGRAFVDLQRPAADGVRAGQPDRPRRRGHAAHPAHPVRARPGPPAHSSSARGCGPAVPASRRMTAFVAEQLATAHWFDQRRDAQRPSTGSPRVGIDEGLERLAASFA